MPIKKVINKSALMPTALIAGGAGFLGSQLAETLLLQNTRVIVLDNFKTGKENFVNHLLSNPNFALYNVDINQGVPGEIQGVDYVFQLAGLEAYYGANEANLDTLLTNAVGTKVLLDFAGKCGAKFVLASSIYVYQGMLSQVDLNQYFGKTKIDESKFSLMEAKRYAEALVWEYYKKNDVDVRIVRLPEIYGPKMNFDASGSLGRLVSELTSNKNLTIYGEGVEKEYYVYVNDAVAGVVKATFGPKTKGKIYSLVGQDYYSPLEVAFLLKGMANRDLTIEYKPKTDEAELRKVQPDTSNLKEINWSIQTAFKDGVLKTLHWFGYEPNQYSFKPTKLIEDKKKEKSGRVAEEIDSIAGLIQPTQPLFVAPSTTPSPQKPMPVVKRPKLPKINFAFHNPFKSIALGNSMISKVIILVAIALIFVFVVMIGIPGAQIYFNLNRVAADVKEIPVVLGQLDTQTAKQISEDAFVHLYKAQAGASKLQWLFKLTGKSAEFDSYIGTLSSAAYATRASYYFAKASTPVSTLWEVIRPNSTQTFDSAGFETAKADLELARNNLQLAEAQLKNVDASVFSGGPKKYFEEYSGILDKVSQNMDMITSAFTGLSDLIGVDTPKKYLILFQNSAEIRPTGGFIGSYAVLSLEQGKIKSLTIDDIYNPDGQIDLRQIQVASPAPIKSMLNEQYLHIRNANWNPDFTISAGQIEDLLGRVTGENYDGVIAVDLYFAKNLLDVTGPIFLTAYNEEISSENLYERAQYHSEFNYTEGSDQKRSFLTILGGKLLEKIFAQPKEDLPKFWAALETSLTDKHMLVYLKNNQFGAFLNERAWDGSLVKTSGDYLYVVNSNLGGTKANYYVKNNMKYEIVSATRDGVLRGALTLSYNHTGESDAWPGGPYKNYLRVLTQTGSKLTGAKIKFKDKAEEEIFKTVAIAQVGKYNSFETSFTLNPRDAVEVTLYYDLPATTTLSADSMAYTLYWQKQPGTQDDNFEFIFGSPFGLQSNVDKLSGVLSKDQSISVTLKPL